VAKPVGEPEPEPEPPLDDESDTGPPESPQEEDYPEEEPTEDVLPDEVPEEPSEPSAPAATHPPAEPEKEPEIARTDPPPLETVPPDGGVPQPAGPQETPGEPAPPVAGPPPPGAESAQDPTQDPAQDPTQGTAPGPAAQPREGTEDVPKPDPSLRRKLKEMIEKLRDKLGPPPEPEVPPSEDTPFGKHARLFKYLMGLAGSLPPDRDREYQNSEERLKLAGLHARLSGRETLRDKLDRLRKKKGTPAEEKTSVDTSLDRKKIAATFDYIGDVSTYLPDKDIGEQLRTRATAVSIELLKPNQEDT
jgi:hypothetical protein